MRRQTTSNSTYRSTTDLSGSWQFATDPDGAGRPSQWYASDAAWPERAHSVEIPHAWQEDATYRDYTGAAWYRRTVDLEPPPDRRAILRFGAVDYETTVWVNGVRVGENRGGYLPFEFDVTDAVVDGENLIVVEVVDPADIREIPHGKQGAPWYQRVSGIWQDVTLEYVPETRVKDVRATPNLASDSVRFDVTTIAPDGDTADTTATIEVTRKGEAVAEATTVLDSDGHGTTTLKLEDPDYWSPDSPALYDVTVFLNRDGSVVDRYGDYFGMRSIETRDGLLYLNGDPLFVRGALDQGYYPRTLYRPFDDELFEAEIRIAKDLGFNLLRKHIKPAHPKFLEAADRLGILVWEEPANPTVHTERSKRELRTQIHQMIDRDYNRPCVVIWSLYNEEWGIGNPQGLDEETSLWEDEAKQNYLADLYAEVASVDPTRVVCDNSGWAHVATDINDYHRYFVSPDRADAWAADLEAMTANPEENYGATMTDPVDAPLIVSEFGTWGLCDVPAIEEYYGGEPPWYDYDFFDESSIKRPAGVHERFQDTTLPDVFDDWSELAEAWQWREYRSIKNVIEQMRAHEEVAGYVITEFSDIEWEFNGILDYRREEKAFTSDFARINDDVLVTVTPERHAVRPGETLTADIVVSNHTTDPIDGTVEWSAFDSSGSVPVTLNGFGVASLEGAIEIPIPDVEEVVAEEVVVSLTTGSTDAESRNAEPITVAPKPSIDGDETVYADDENLSDLLDGVGFDVVSKLDSSVDVALVTESTDDAVAYADGGGTVLRLPGEDGHLTDDDFFEYRSLPDTESWNLVASLFYRADGPLQSSLQVVPGWELEGLYPYEVVRNIDREDEVHLGYVEGWLENWSAAVAVRECGEGRVGAFTFRVTGQTENPVGTSALVALVADLARD